MNTTAIDLVATKLVDAALTVLARTCRKEVAAASRDELEAVCAAMRTKAPLVIDELLDDARAAPHMAQAAFHAAVLELAQAGIAVLRKDAR